MVLESKNLLVAHTQLARLDRVPAFADHLWSRVHRREGACIFTERAILASFETIFDRLGLAIVAKNALPNSPSEDLDRLYLVALFELAHGALSKAALVTARFFELEEVHLLSDLAVEPDLAVKEPLLAEFLRTLRPAILRIETLGMEATSPKVSRMRTAQDKGQPPLAAERVELTGRGVSVSKGPKRLWMDIHELADLIVADATLAIEAVAKGIMRAIDQGHALQFDERIELT